MQMVFPCKTALVVVLIYKTLFIFSYTFSIYFSFISYISPFQYAHISNTAPSTQLSYLQWLLVVFILLVVSSFSTISGFSRYPSI